MDRTVFGVGFLGRGKYKPKEYGNKETSQYRCWKDMMRRCYDTKYISKNSTYKDCIVCEEWHNFQNFAKWYDDNYYEIDGQKMSLDKDIIKKGNKVYSPEFCVFVPQRINTLFIKSNSIRGNLPIGVTYHKGRYIARIRDGSKDRKLISLGSFDNEIDAFNSYRRAKEKLIKDVANIYKNKIPEKLYNAMINYCVEIND